VPYLMCPACSLTIPEPPTLFAPRSCARCRLVRGERVRLERVEDRSGPREAESSDESDQAATT
jgi:hypothetical protein